MQPPVNRTMTRSPGFGPSSGFTLVELLITITIAGILAGIALPSFQNLMRTQRVKSAAFDLVSNLTLTRSEAVKRNANVSMTAAGGGWKNGWKISVGGTDLRVQDKYTGLDITELAGLNVVTFRGDGRLATATTNFTVQTDPASGVTPRCISISLSGQASSKMEECS